MPDYEHAQIYQIINTVDDKIYVGSTTRSLRRRLQDHRSTAKIKNLRVYQHLNEVGWENVLIELLEPFSCESKEELFVREQHYIELLEPELNTRRAMGGPCEHNRRRNNCKDCGGTSICEHGRQRHTCKECGGAGICEHNRRRNQCKDCGGASICEHNKRRLKCKECGGSQICEHNRIKNQCKDCSGDKYRCDTCDKTYCGKSPLTRHLLTNSHKNRELSDLHYNNELSEISLMFKKISALFDTAVKNVNILEEEL